MKYIFLSLRPKQWVKNLFIFLPLVFGGKLFVFPANLTTLIAFFLFSMLTSAAYLINDIIDIEQDRAHPTKRFRPIASGKVTVGEARLVAFILGILSISLAFASNLYFGLTLVVYLFFNILYSKVLKTVVIIDVFSLALFFYLRLIAGSIMAGVELSHWIVFMTVLLSFFLGFNKRRQEMRLTENEPSYQRTVLIHYNPYFIDQMIAVVTSSLAVVYMLYTVDARTVREFGTNHLMYTIVFVYYGIFRYLYLIHKLRKEGDPTTILFSDAKMIINLVLWITVSIAVIYFRF